MTITQEITKKETVVREIELPHYSKVVTSWGFNTFYRINEDESVLKAIASDNYGNITYSKKDNAFAFPATGFREAVEAEPCTKEEVEAAVVMAINFMDNEITQLKKKKKVNVVDLAENLYRTY